MERIPPICPLRDIVKEQAFNIDEIEGILGLPRCESTSDTLDSRLQDVVKLKGFKLASLNINSLLKHIDEIRIILANSSFDILAINESKIDDLIPDTEINILGYNLIRNDRNRAGGGVVLYIRDSIPYTERRDLIPDRLEMICIEVNRPHSKSFLVSTWYRPPNSDMELLDECDLFFSKCDSENKELLLAGDLNCDVIKNSPDLHTRRLQFLCSLYQIEQLINEPTRVTETSSTLIDLILTNRQENISSFGVIHLGISDHSLVYAVRKSIMPRSRPTVKEVRDFKNFNKDDFLADLARVPWDVVQDSDDPNECWRVWKLFFHEILNIHAPLRHKRTRKYPIPWITPYIKQLMKNRDFHKKQSIKHASQTHWVKFQAARNKVNIEMRNAKSKFFCDRIEDCVNNVDPKKSWSLINTLLGKNIKSTNISELLVNDTVISDPKLIAESFNEYFINIGPKLAAESNIDSAGDDPQINDCAGFSPDSCFRFSQIDVVSVALTLKNLKASKATGLDKIPAKILKLSSDIIAPSLTAIFNLSLVTGIFVHDWKFARVSPIFKSDDRRKRENYRPISILPIISKVFEKEVFRQVYTYLTKNSLLSNFQSGFRPKHSTLSALIQMCDEWLESMDNGKLTGVIFLDIRKAFDSINHGVLLKKMNDCFGISDMELRWFGSYLSDRTQQCFVNGQMSSPKQIICGVPQGSIMGPLLFLLYINDMPDCLKSTIPCLYADDTQIFSSSHDSVELIANLNSDLTNVHNWLAKNKLQIHPAKSKLMFIGSSYSLNNKLCDHPVLVNNVPIPRIKTQKCLGVDIDENLSWEKHVETICKKAGAGIGVIRRIKPFVPHDILQSIYKALVQPYFDYCSPLWDTCGKLLKDKLQKFQSRAARVITGASYEVRSADVLEALSWEILNVRRSKAKSILMYKILNDHTAPSLKKLFIRRNEKQHFYNLRNSDTDLSLPKPKREFLKRSFKYSGAMLWNDLTYDDKLAGSLYSFKRRICLR